MRTTIMLLAVLGLASAGTPARAAAPVKCPHHGIAVRVDHHGGRCLSRAVLRHVRKPGPTSERALRAGWRRLDRTIRQVRRLRHVSPRRRRQALTLLERFRVGVIRERRAAAASAQGPPAVPLPIDPDAVPAGWDVRSWIDPYPDNPKGGSADSNGTAHLQASATSPDPVATRIRIRRATTKVLLWDCPDRNGDAKGTVRFRERTTLTVTDLHTGRVLDRHEFDQGYDGHFQAHVTDDALLKDYDLVVDTHNGGQRAHFVFRGLQLDQPWEIQSAYHIAWGGSTGGKYLEWDMDGPQTKSVVLSDFPDSGTEALFVLAGRAKDAANASVRDAFISWFEFADCVRVTFTPPGGAHSPNAPPLRVSIGVATGVAVAARSRLDQRLIGAAVEYRFDLGTVTPATDRLRPDAPGRMTLVARRERRTANEGVVMRANSKRGRVQGSLDVIARSAVPAAYVGTVSGTLDLEGHTETWNGSNVTFTRDPAGGTAYFPTSGTFAWSMSSLLGECTVNATATLSLAGDQYDLSSGTTGGVIYTDYDRGTYTGNGSWSKSVPVQAKCPDGSSFDVPWPVYDVWLDMGFSAGREWPRRPGENLAGSFSGADGATWQWNLAPVM
jgi:hypothetical protein